MVATLLAAPSSQAISQNSAPEIEDEPWIEGADVVARSIEEDDAAREASITTLAEADWPETESVDLVLEEDGTADVSALASVTRGEDTVVGIGAVPVELLDTWEMPFPLGTLSDSPGASAERRLPREPDDEIPIEDRDEATEENEREGEPPAVQSEEPVDEEPRPDEEDEGENVEDEPVEAVAEEEVIPEAVESARVELLSKAEAAEAGVDGLLLEVTRTDGIDAPGPVEVVLDYSGFDTAFGGDYGSRLRLLALADCEDDQEDECTRAYDLESVNDPATKTLTVIAPATTYGTTLLAAAGGGSGNGDYQATDLSPSASWDVSLQTGDFAWTYPLDIPDVAGDMAPDISLSYSSGAVDGRTASTNNQASWIGEGFDYHPGFIERTYIPCAEDGQKAPNKTGDMCWKRHNATLSLNGMSSELLLDSDGTWRMRNDDGSKVERLTGTTNGDNDGEYWKVTTTDGTQYFFGRNRLPGWSSGKPETNSAWTMPVFGNGSGEPCNKSSFADSWCQQAWRWNLDYVVDVQGNVMTLHYTKEKNHYGRNMKADDGTPYDRGGYLRRIEYGLTTDDVFATAPARVNFTVAERCLTTGSFDCAPEKREKDNARHWPDVPLDQDCKSGSKCSDKFSPSFFSTKRLERVATQIHDGSSYSTVDSWKFEHAFPAPGDGTDPTLWLDSITHTGHVGGTLANPSLTFSGTPMPNRVDSTSDGVAPLNKWRVTSVYTETGGQLDISYSDPDCTAGSTPTPHTNTKRCYPVRWVPSGRGDDDITDWFHKYVVTQVLEVDLVTDQPDVVTTYDYRGGGAWRYMDADGFTKDDKRTWSQWRGYEVVRVNSGAADGVRSEEEHRFFRGMHGDHQPSGTRSVKVTDTQGGEHTDHDRYNGQTLETLTRNGPGGEVLEKEITLPWSRKTGSRTYSWGTLESYLVDTASVRGYTPLADGGWRHHRVDTTYDDLGMPIEVFDHGDLAVEGDELCARTTYARNSSLHLLELPAREELLSVGCESSPERPDDVIGDIRTLYDGKAFGETPTQGVQTSSERLTGYDGSTPRYQVTETSTFDRYGRQLTETDAEGNTTTTEYTDHTPGGAATGITITNPEGHTNSLEIDPARTLTVAEVDANGKRTDLAYDPLGRLTEVWLADRAKDRFTPSMKFGYHLSKDSPTYITSSELNPHGDYVTSYQLHDGWLRVRQTQTPASDGGRLISDTLHDSRGLQVQTRAAYPNENEPGPALFRVENTDDIPRYTETVYDGAERPLHQIQMSKGEEQYRTTNEYIGEQTRMTPPEGGTGTTTITDLRGNTVELRHHHGRSPSGEYDAIRYAYTPSDELETVTDTAGNEWRYTYDINGRRVSSSDPDTGTTTYTYDALDRVTSTTDARGRTLAHVYDSLGRKVALREDSEQGPLRIEWVYDTLAKGQLTSATRHDGGLAYSSRVLSYDDLYRAVATTITIPREETGLGGTYRFITRYNEDGSVDRHVSPAAGGLSPENIDYTYDTLGRVTSVEGDGTYVTGADYSKVGNLVRRVLARTESSNDRYWQAWDYNEATNRLNETRIVPRFGAGSLQHLYYSYDDAGNILSLRDEPSDSERPSDVQCFSYDHMRQLTEAWTPDATGPDSCEAAPKVEDLGGPAPYWHSYAYDSIGNRVTETRHGGIGGATERTYTHPDAGQDQPHTLTQVVESGPAGERLEHYGYDEAGNMVSRTTPAHEQGLEWDSEGLLVKVEDASNGVTTYTYDANGDRLIRRDANTSTLYLPGMEIHRERTSTIQRALRFYEHAGETIAVRDSDDNVTWIFSDHHGTGQLAVEAVGGEVTQRRFTAFGGDRGTGGEWPTERGFVGGTVDSSTGLTQIGARAYDAALGRFISPDPVMDVADPQQMHGYTYANSNPVSFTDPDGLFLRKTWNRVRRAASRARNRARSAVRRVWNSSRARVRSVRATVRRTVVYRARRTHRVVNRAVRRVPQRPRNFAAGVGNALTWSPVRALGDYTVRKLGAPTTQDMLTSVGVNTNSNSFKAGEATVDVAVEVITGPVPAGSAMRVLRNGGKIKDSFSWFRRGGRSTCSGNSFASGTLVVMADGTTKAIEDIRVGEKVLATDPEGGEEGPREVLATIIGSGTKTLVEITVDTTTQVEASELEGGVLDEVIGLPGPTVLGDVIIATDGHPFWSPEMDAWVDAIDLVPGMWLLSSEGTLVQVSGIQTWTQPATVYNLTVQDIHTYYVLAGETPALVHNKGGCIPALRDWSGQRFQFGNQAFLLDKRGMEHILTRHHPKIWDGSVKPRQSFFDPGMSVADVQDAIGQVMRQNRDTLVQRGSANMYQIQGRVNGVDYVLGMHRGRVGQFYPGAL
ncbi:polymorphic toxin-type HINT domain-containing protein [Nocardiopsis alba]|uniref:polymorphic toxin-type HINT domain-containing protein n=1 Tax=Nocardiopsis alba TaxID=53437 RepID=UPI0033B33187